MATIGIDFGTTNSVISFFEKDAPIIIPNLRGSRLTPSIVSIDANGKIFVGESAKNQILFNIEGTITEVKRKIGTDFVYKIYDKEYTPTEIASYIIMDLKRSAESYLGESVDKVIITVPAHFSETQRLEIKNACHQAELQVERMLNEPTAAALSYTYTATDDKNFIVYDLGGGTFDVSILNKTGNNFIVKATCGDAQLGGKDIDLMLYDIILAEFEKENDVTLKGNPMMERQLLDSIENAKKELSMSTEVNITIPFLSSDKKSIHLNYTLTRDRFNELISPFVKRSIDLMQKAILDAGLKNEDIGGIIYSGGSSRIPLIHETIEKEFGFENTYKVNPDEIVSLGASVSMASSVDADESKITKPIISFQDVTYFTIGIEADNNIYIPLIKRNSPLPVTKKKVFTTVVDNQEEVEIHILQGESHLASENISLSKFSLRGISIGPKGKPKIEVTFYVDKDGITHISAQDLDTGKRGNVDIILDGKNIYDKNSVDYQKDPDIRKIDNLKNQIEYLSKKYSLKNHFMVEYKEIVYFLQKAIDSKDKDKIAEGKDALEIFYNELKEVVIEN